MEKPHLLDALISHFQTAPYWALKSLNEHVKQPQMYLRECLAEIATLIPKGPYANMWTLKPEFKGTAGTPASTKAGKATLTATATATASGGGSGAGVVGQVAEGNGEDVKPQVTGSVKTEDGDLASVLPSGGGAGDDDDNNDDDNDDDDDLEMVS